MILVLVVLALIGGILIGIAVGRRMGWAAAEKHDRGVWDDLTRGRYDPSDSAGA